jgi:hypothetical protein
VHLKCFEIHVISCTFTIAVSAFCAFRASGPQLNVAFTSRTSYTFSALVAGPLITAPVVMSKSEPWHWHMIVVPRAIL